MSVIKSHGAGDPVSSGFYNGIATQSLRYDGGAKLTRTPSSSGDQKKWTTSLWVKRCEIGTSHYLWASDGYSGNNGICALYFRSDDTLATYFDTTGTNPYGSVNSRKYRDLSAWYNIIWAVDAANTVQRIWVNGVEESLSSSLNPPNYSYGMNRSGTKNEFGIAAWGSSPSLKGYLSNIVHIDGQYLTNTSFGEFKNGIWIPIDTSGLTFGTNGFYLEHKQTGVGTASTSTIGADTSGNTNHFTSSGIVASDCNMPDSPENNFCIMNPNARGTTNISTNNGNLYFVKSGANYGNMFSTFALFSGKWYFEGRNHGSALAQIGVQEVINNIYASSGDYGANTDLGMWDSRGYYLDEGTAGGSPPSYGDGDIIGVAFDVDAGKIWFSKNGTYNHSGDPANGTNQTTGSTNDLSSIGVTPAGNGENGGGLIMNFGQDSSFNGAETAQGNTDGNGIGDFYYSPPSGFLAICTANLPNPTIGPSSDTQADDHFKTVIYNGSSGAQTITTGLQPDWIWIKVRSLTGYHNITDTSRGITKELYSNTTDDEENNGRVESSSTTGFTFPSTEYGYTNENGQTFVSWNWHANGGSATASGSESGNTLAYSSQANTTAGFSITTYTGNGVSNADITVNHGLGVTPDWVIIKNRSDATRWQVWHKDLSADGTYTTKNLRLNSDGAEQAFSSQIKSVSSSAVIVRDPYAASNANVNKDSSNYVMYCFHSVEAYSRFGKYSGNGSTDGTYVFTGFKPAWIMAKRIDTADNWAIYDSVRDTFNVLDSYIYADSSQAETTYSTALVDFLSNGFKWRGAVNFGNNSSGTYIYMAFAEAPFKFALAR